MSRSLQRPTFRKAGWAADRRPPSISNHMRLLHARLPPGAGRRGKFPGPPGPTCFSRRPSCSLQRASRRLSSASWLSSSLACGESRIQSAVGDLGAEAHAVPGRHLLPREGPAAPTRASVFPAPAGCRRGTGPQDDTQTEGLQCSPEAKSHRGGGPGEQGSSLGRRGLDGSCTAPRLTAWKQRTHVPPNHARCLPPAEHLCLGPGI